MNCNKSAWNTCVHFNICHIYFPHSIDFYFCCRCSLKHLGVVKTTSLRVKVVKTVYILHALAFPHLKNFPVSVYRFVFSLFLNFFFLVLNITLVISFIVVCNGSVCEFVYFVEKKKKKKRLY